MKGTNIKAKIIADSISVHTDTRLTTYELEFPRWILAEVNTHRIASKNGASSRAIPFDRMVELCRTNMALPVHWGKNQAGMVAQEEIADYQQGFAAAIWAKARESAIEHATDLHKMGVHKQICNRLLEPFMMMKMVFSATSYKNLFELRAHPDAQPEFQDLAYKMQDAYNMSLPIPMKMGEWHLPYVEISRDLEDDRLVYSSNGKEIDLKTAVKLSASLCAQVSYRRQDDTIEKAIQVFDRLITSKPLHASPMEHQASPMFKHFKENGPNSEANNGIGDNIRFLTSMNLTDQFSGNLKNWSQYRQILQRPQVI